jgi:hypothetical protein
VRPEEKAAGDLENTLFFLLRFRERIVFHISIPCQLSLQISSNLLGTRLNLKKLMFFPIEINSSILLLVSPKEMSLADVAQYIRFRISVQEKANALNRGLAASKTGKGKMC